jgi:hypothetical protein
MQENSTTVIDQLVKTAGHVGPSSFAAAIRSSKIANWQVKPVYTGVRQQTGEVAAARLLHFRRFRHGNHDSWTPFPDDAEFGSKVAKTPRQAADSNATAVKFDGCYRKRFSHRLCLVHQRSCPPW